MAIVQVAHFVAEDVSNGVQHLYNTNDLTAAFRSAEGTPVTVGANDLFVLGVALRNDATPNFPTVSDVGIWHEDAAVELVAMTQYVGEGPGGYIADTTGGGVIASRDYSLWLFYAFGDDITPIVGMDYEELLVTLGPSESAWGHMFMSVWRDDAEQPWSVDLANVQVYGAGISDAGGDVTISCVAMEYDGDYLGGMLAPIMWVSRLDANTDGLISDEIDVSGDTDLLWPGGALDYSSGGDWPVSDFPDGMWDEANVGKAAVGMNAFLLSSNDDLPASIDVVVQWNPADGATDNTLYVFSGFVVGSPPTPTTSTRQPVRARRVTIQELPYGVTSKMFERELG